MKAHLIEAGITGICAPALPGILWLFCGKSINFHLLHVYERQVGTKSKDWAFWLCLQDSLISFNPVNISVAGLCFGQETKHVNRPEGEKLRMHLLDKVYFRV